MKRKLSLLTALIVMLVITFMPSGLSREAMMVVGIFAGTLILWINIAIDWPSILCLLLLSLVPSIGMNGVLKSSFGSSTIMFLIMTFILTYAFSKTSYIKRTAIFFIDQKWVKNKPWMFVLAFLFSMIVVGSFISPTVLFVIYLPILETILEILNIKKGEKIASMLMMGMVFSSAISSGMTPIAHVFPLISMGLVNQTMGISVSYVKYMSFAIPVGILSFLMMILLFKYLYRPDVKKLSNVNIDILKEDILPITKQEKYILYIFILVVLMWVLPGIIKPLSTGVLLDFINSYNKLTSAFAPMIGVSLLFIIQSDGKPLLSFKDAMSNGVLWSAIIMCCATLALGSALTSKDLGITTFLTNELTPIIQGLSPYVLVGVFILWAAIQTNLSSNMVTATLVTGIVLTVFVNDNFGINVAALASLVGMMSAYAFATPPAMPSIAIAIGSGQVSAKDIMKYGFILMFIAVILSATLGYTIANFFI